MMAEGEAAPVPAEGAAPSAVALLRGSAAPPADGEGRSQTPQPDGQAGEGPAQPEPLTGPPPDAGPDPAPGGQSTAEDSVPRGLDRLTAGRLQVQQVVEELSRALPEMEDGHYRLTLKLHPEHLGEVKLELNLARREVWAAMEVASADARQALESRGDQLRQSLSDAGYNLAGFEVATGQGRQPRQEAGQEPAGWQEPYGRGAALPEGAAASAVSRIRSPGPRRGRLDTMA